MRKLMLLLSLFFITIALHAQLMHCEIKNITQPNPSTIDFDVYLYHTGTDTIRLQAFQGGVNFNYNALANGGTITGSFIAGSSFNPATNTQLPLQQQAPNWNINSISHQIRLLATIQTVKSTAAIVPNATPGLKLGTFRMVNTVPFNNCITPGFIWSFTAGGNISRSLVTGWVNNSPTGSLLTTQSSFSYMNQGPEFFVQSNPSINYSSSTTNLTINHCGPYTFQGNTYTTSGIYTDTLPSVSVCDSIVVINLSVYEKPDVLPEPLVSLTCGACVDIANLISPLSFIPSGSDTAYYTNTSYSTLFPNPHAVCSANTLYMIVKNGIPGCADTAEVNIGAGSSTNQIANQTNTNTTTCSNIPIVNRTISNGATELFINPNDCKRVTSISDANNSISLGLTSVEETINCTIPTYNNQPYLKRVYQVTPTNQDAATICLYYLQDDIITYNTYASANGWPQINPSTLAGFTISQTHNGDFNTMGHTVTVIPNASLTKTFDAVNQIWTVCFPVTSFSYFYAHAVNPNNLALGVSLKEFKATKQEQTSLVSWITSNERNNDYFILERSHNGVDFTSISSPVLSKGIGGNSSVELAYNFVDQHPYNGHNYYRLAQYDLDTRVSRSEAIDVFFESKDPIRIFPNPANDEIQLEIISGRSSKIQIEITDATGRIVHQYNNQLRVGMNTLLLNIHDLQSGVYLVHVSNQFGMHEIQKLIKK